MKPRRFASDTRASMRFEVSADSGMAAEGRREKGEGRREKGEGRREKGRGCKKGRGVKSGAGGRSMPGFRGAAAVNSHSEIRTPQLKVSRCQKPARQSRV